MEKSAGGRPRKWQSVEELETAIQDYFDGITITEALTETITTGYKDKAKKKPITEQRPILNDKGEQVHRKRYFEHPTVTGLCLHLGIVRSTLIDYENLPEFSNTIKKAKAKIEGYLEQELYREKGHTGLIFNLKNNFGWKDKQEMDIGNVDGKAFKIDMTDEERKSRINELLQKREK